MTKAVSIWVKLPSHWDFSLSPSRRVKKLSVGSSIKLWQRCQQIANFFCWRKIGNGFSNPKRCFFTPCVGWPNGVELSESHCRLLIRPLHELNTTQPEGRIIGTGMIRIAVINSASASSAITKSFCKALPSAKRYCSSGETSGRTEAFTGVAASSSGLRRLRFHCGLRPLHFDQIHYQHQCQQD